MSKAIRVKGSFCRVDGIVYLGCLGTGALQKLDPTKQQVYSKGYPPIINNQETGRRNQAESTILV